MSEIKNTDSNYNTPLQTLINPTPTIRELKEEIGIDIVSDSIVYYNTFKA